MESESKFDINFNLPASEFKNFNVKNLITEKSNDNSNGLSLQSEENYKNHTVHEKSADISSKNMKNNAVISLVPKMEKLHLTDETKSSDSDCGLFGYVKTVIAPIGTVVIRLATEGKIMDIGTAVFVQRTGGKKYRDIGYITDIFGSVLEPMYSVILNKWSLCDSLELESKAYFMYDHPSTRFVSIERYGERYVVKQNQMH